MGFAETVRAIDSFLWGDVFVVWTLVIGFYLTFGSKFFSFRYFGFIFKNTLFKKQSKTAQKGSLTPFEAMCVALGGCVGTGNISGVAAAIAVGGPGAVFWLWMYAILGMTIKVVEVTLGCYYRSRTPDGEFFGGPTYYIEKGLGQERGFKGAVIMAYVFGICLCMQWIAGGSLYAAAESAETCFNMPPLLYIAIYAVFLILVTARGVNSVGKFASKAVPVMTVMYLAGGIIMVVVNITEVPGVLALIFKSAFTGTAAVGGFAGATVRLAIQKGLSRAVNSNEAGQGSSPMIHATADTRHPVEQGMWGAVEVFMDTIVVCSITSIAILVTGAWSTGETSATLTITAFESVFGTAGVLFMGIMVTIFAFTTNSGWFSYFNTCLNYFLRNHEAARLKASSIFKKIYSVPVVLFAALLFYTDAGANVFWDIIDAVIALPTYINLAALLFLSGTFFRLLKDYKARYMGVGQVDFNFKYFYDTEPNAEAKAHDAALQKARANNR